MTVPAVHRLYVKSAPDALSGGKVENLVANAESGSASRVTLVAVRYQEDVLVDDRLKGLRQSVCVSRRQDRAGGRPAAVGGDENRDLLPRQAALAGLAAPAARLAIKLPLPLRLART